MALLQDAARGRPLDRRLVRKDPGAALNAAIRWSDDLLVGPCSKPDVDDRAASTWRRSLRRLECSLDATTTANNSRAAELLSQLDHADLPVVFEHGDLCNPNIFLTDSGELVLIDWEHSRQRGLPLHDLTRFVGYLAETVDTPGDSDELAASYRKATEPGGWARGYLDRNALRMDLDPKLVPALMLASWTRTLAGPVRQTTPHGPAARARYETLWLAAIDQADREPL